MSALTEATDWRRSTFAHITIGSNDLKRARNFYDATFAALGDRRQPAGPYAVGAFFVFLDLLEGNFELCRERCLTNTALFAPLTQSRADSDICRVRHPITNIHVAPLSEIISPAALTTVQIGEKSLQIDAAHKSLPSSPCKGSCFARQMPQAFPQKPKQRCS